MWSRKDLSQTGGVYVEPKGSITDRGPPPYRASLEKVYKRKNSRYGEAQSIRTYKDTCAARTERSAPRIEKLRELYSLRQQNNF